MKALKSLCGTLTITCGLAVTGYCQSSLTNGLVAYYPFNGNADDATGNGNDGYIIGGPASTTNRFGQPNSALCFNGTNSFVAISNKFLNIGADYTLTMWVCTFDTSRQFQGLVGTLPNPAIDISYNIPLNGADLHLEMSIGNGTDWLQPTQQHGPKQNYLANQWYQVAAIKSGSSYSTFVNGVLDASFSRSPGSLLIELLLGQQWYGIMDDIRVYSRSLSASEVQQLYQYESQPQGNVTSYFSTANPNQWQIAGGGATNATPYETSAVVPDSISITSTAGNDGNYVVGMASFTGFWLADYHFNVPYGATGVSLTYSNFVVDDRGIILLNGNPIVATGVPYFGSLNPGSLVYTDGGSPQAYSSFVTQPASGIVTSGFNIGGQNTLRVIVNNTHEGVVGPDVPLSPTDGTLLTLSGAVSYTLGPTVSLIRAVKPSFANLTPTANYQLQVSSDLNNWTNQGSPFTATNTSMVYPQYFDVDNWGKLFFRLLSSDLNNWTNQGSPFTATNTSMVYPQYFDVDNWGKLFFRLLVAP